MLQYPLVHLSLCVNGIVSKWDIYGGYAFFFFFWSSDEDEDDEDDEDFEDDDEWDD